MDALTRRQIVFSWRSRQRLDDQQSCRRVLQHWLEFLPGYLPETYNYYEPINLPCDLADIEGFLPEWQWGIFFRRRKVKPAFDASFFYKKPGPNFPVHASWSIDVHSDAMSPGPFVRLLEQSAKSFKVDFACVTLFGALEGEHGRRRGTSGYTRRDRPPTDFRISTQTLERGIPDLYWYTLLGKPYVEMFGMEHLLITPAAEVKQLSKDTVGIRLTNDVRDTEDRRDAFQAARLQAKQHLGLNAFMREDGTLPEPAMLPRFNFGED